MICEHLKWIDREGYSIWGCALTENGSSPDGKYEGCPHEMEGTHGMDLYCERYEEVHELVFGEKPHDSPPPEDIREDVEALEKMDGDMREYVWKLYSLSPRLARIILKNPPIGGNKTERKIYNLSAETRERIIALLEEGWGR